MRKPKPKTNQTCSITGCDEPVYCCTMCANCYQYTYYWSRKTIAQRVQRQEQVAKFQARLDSMTVKRPKLRLVK